MGTFLPAVYIFWEVFFNPFFKFIPCRPLYGEKLGTLQTMSVRQELNNKQGLRPYMKCEGMITRLSIVLYIPFISTDLWPISKT